MKTKREKINVNNGVEEGELCCCGTNQRRVFGWEDELHAAEDIWRSLHHTLLEGDLVFAFKNQESGDLKQLVIVKNKNGKPGYGVGYITSGYTALLPTVPLIYLKEDAVEMMTKYKVTKEVIEIYKQIINSEHETISN